MARQSRSRPIRPATAARRIDASSLKCWRKFDWSRKESRTVSTPFRATPCRTNPPVQPPLVKRILEADMPRILRGLDSRALACGCLVGVYETYRGQTIAIIDAKGVTCAERAHRVDSPVDL